MIKHAYQIIHSVVDFILELKNLSVSQWDVEEHDSTAHSVNFRQKR